jgi:hypothetical protein
MSKIKKGLSAAFASLPTTTESASFLPREHDTMTKDRLFKRGMPESF